MANTLLSKLAQFRDKEEFIDVRLQVSDALFPAHRIVLAANSDYFHAMFTKGMKESKQEVIELKEPSISAEALGVLLNSIYTGELCANKENIFDVLAAASHLQITNIVHQCCDFLNVHFVQDRFDFQRYCQLSAVADRHGLKELQENVQHKMASIYKDVCGNEAFLSQINPDQLLSLLVRDDLSAPSETFVFKSVMRWINHHKEERLPVAAKIIEAVRLGLVDVGVLIEELNTEEIQKVPEIHKILIDASLYFNAPSQMSKFAEKTKPRTPGQVLVAILPKSSQAQYFDVETKLWKPLPSMAVLPGGDRCVCTEVVGNNLYVAVNDCGSSHVYSYNIDKNLWEKLPRPLGSINSLCKMSDFLYAVSSDCNTYPQRYSFAKRQWQSITRVRSMDTVGTDQSDFIREKYLHGFSLDKICYNGAAVFDSELRAFFECTYSKLAYHSYSGRRLPAPETRTITVNLMQSFCESSNRWIILGSNRLNSYGFTPFVVNQKLYAAGGRGHDIPDREPAHVSVYDKSNIKWLDVNQYHIPPNNLGAVEIEGKVYFIINKFLVDSGIRIPSTELYPVCLSDWEGLRHVSANAALCYLPLKEGMKG